jgi:hypothetical protein
MAPAANLSRSDTMVHALGRLRHPSAEVVA